MRKNIVAWVGFIAYLVMPLITAKMYVERGYYAIGGEWFIPLLAMIVAYYWKPIREELIDMGYLMLGLVVLTYETVHTCIFNNTK